jgi:hypothetical protein
MAACLPLSVAWRGGRGVRLISRIPVLICKIAVAQRVPGNERPVKLTRQLHGNRHGPFLPGFGPVQPAVGLTIVDKEHEISYTVIQMSDI